MKIALIIVGVIAVAAIGFSGYLLRVIIKAMKR